MNATPPLFGHWLRYLRAYTRENKQSGSGDFIFINAWNEWGEGCHLEPDLKWGLGYLEEVLRSSYNYGVPKSSSEAREDLYTAVAAVAAGREASGIVIASAQSIGVDMRNYRPVKSYAHKISAHLGKWPTVYKIARFIYLLARRVRG